MSLGVLELEYMNHVGIKFEVNEPSIFDIEDTIKDTIFIDGLKKENYDLSIPEDVERLNFDIQQLEITIDIYEGILSIYEKEKVIEKSTDKEFTSEAIRKMTEVLESGKIKWANLYELIGVCA